MADPNVTAAFMQATINCLREKGLLDDQDVEAINAEASDILKRKVEEVEEQYRRARTPFLNPTSILRGSAGLVPPGGPVGT